MDAKISESFWDDMVDQPQEIKTAALWMMTNSTRNVMGVFRYLPQKFAFETRLPAQVLDQTMGACPRMAIRAGEKVLLVHFVGWQFGRGPKLRRNRMARALVKPFWESPPEIQKAFLVEYPELRGVVDGTAEEQGPSPWVAPTLARVEQRAKAIGVSKEQAANFFRYYDGLDWTINGNRMVRWWQWLPKWKARSDELAAVKKYSSDKRGHQNSRSNTLQELEAQLQAETNPAKREELRGRIKELELG